MSDLFSHVPGDLLNAFVEGDLDEAVAAHIAEHLDSCPACATRAATLEPLASAFATVPDPVTPPELVSQLLDYAINAPASPLASAHASEEALGWTEIGVGAALLGAAALLLLAGGEHGRAIAEIGALADVVSRVGGHFDPGALANVVLVGLGIGIGVWYARARGLTPDWRT